MPLNDEQQKVASHLKGRAWVVAGPGSGKTSTITERIGRLLEAGVNPFNILAITFTNKACDEMKVRMTRIYGESVKPLEVRTFHSLCVRILRWYGEAMGYGRNMVIWDDGDQKERMRTALRNKVAVEAGNNTKDENDDEQDKGSSQQKINSLCWICNDWREKLGRDSDLQEYIDEGKIDDIEASAIREYMRRMKDCGAIDFAGLLSETYRLLKSDEEARNALQTRFQYIQVDEYQDTNYAQNQIIELLVGPEDNVLAVGDPDQSIYRWRGASPEGIQNFIKAGKKGCATYVLGTNYRSTPEIISWADTLIKNNKNRHPIEFKTANASNGMKPIVTGFSNPEEEARTIANKIEVWMRQGVDLSQIAIFYRMNDLSRAVEQALSQRHIPNKVVGGQSFYDRMEIKDCMSMLRLLVNGNDGAAFTRLASRVVAGLGEKTIGQIELYSHSSGINLISACDHAHEYMPQKTASQKGRIDAIHSVGRTFHIDRTSKSAADCLMEMVTKLDYKEWLKQHAKSDEEAAERARNVDEMGRDVAEYMSKNAGSTLEDYLDYLALKTSGDDLEDEKFVTLMSGHKCKGTEFDCVFAIGIEEKLIPNDRAVRERPEFGMEEERCVMYVMATRARKFLSMSWCKERKVGYGQRAKIQKCSPSRFLVEAGSVDPADKAKFDRIANQADEF